MRIIAVDDERIALEGLLGAIKKVVPEEEIHDFRSSEEALEYARNNPVDIAFLDIEMREMNGITLAKHLKAICHRVNIIFTTGYGEYRENAFALHVSGYITKPITPEKIQIEMRELRNPIPHKAEKKIRIKTFGNFEVYYGEKALEFKYNKSKELLAYLVDRNGSLCSNSEIMTILWEDGEMVNSHISYLKNTRSDLIAALKAVECEDILEQQRGALRIVPEKTECDYFDYLNQKLSGINAYMGEYMAQYSWAEATHGTLENIE